MVEDRWISYIIPNRYKDWVDPDFNSYTNIEALKEYMLRVHANTDGLPRKTHRGGCFNGPW
jgi:hypothetical protein